MPRIAVKTPLSTKTSPKPIKRSPITRKYKSSKRGKGKSESRSQLVRRLDNIFSRYVRLSAANEYGVVACVSCGVEKPWKAMQNGHFYTRVRYATRWDDMNCNPQCYRCNIILKGNYIEYTKYMIDTHGREAVDELKNISLEVTKITSDELKALVAHYTAAVKVLMNEKDSQDTTS